jgi:predicted phosphodiesterase
MTNKILCIGDLHFSAPNIEYTNELYDCVKTYLDDSKDITTVVLLGDILDGHEKVYTQSLNRALNFIKMISESHLAYLIIGNHDYIDDNQFLTDSHPFNALKHWKNVVVVDHVIVENDKTFMPYVKDNKIEEALQTNPEWIHTKYVFSHIAVNGVVYGIKEVEDSIEWKSEYPMLISGHIHDHQVLKTNVLYVGSAYQVRDGEPNDKCSLLISGDTLEWIKFPISPRGILNIHLPITEVPDIENYSKLIIEGTVEQIKTFQISDIFTKLKESGKIVVMRKANTLNIPEEINEPVQTKSLMELLQELLTDEERVLFTEMLSV